MLGIVLIYFIGKAFYDLADEFLKSKWTYAVLGVISYYVGSFLAGVLMVVFIELFHTRSVDDINDIYFSLMGVPFGLLACYLFHLFLKRKWKKLIDQHSEEISEIGADRTF